MTTTSPLPDRRLVRAIDGRVLGGIAAGIANLTGLRVLWIRIAFAVLVLANGLGLAVYAVFWVFLRQDDGSRFKSDRRGQQLLLGFLLVAAAGSALLIPFGLLSAGKTAIPLLVAVAGVVVVWQQADASQRTRWRQSATATQSGLIRLAIGAVLVVAGLIGFLASQDQLAVARAGLLSTVIVVVGLVVLSSPWWFAMASDLTTERRERIRSQERAEVAAHLHDSVLQTLTLIQKAAASPAEVTRLARGQERELRTWLYATRSGEGSLSAALDNLAAEVEEAHQVPVEVVMVGDHDLDERLTALVAATREAVVNAAKHSGAPLVDVYCEVEPAQVSVFVRDRGVGFDPDVVPEDRHGLSGSVVGRMTRHGGSAEVRSTPGEGTEVRLTAPW